MIKITIRSIQDLTEENFMLLVNESVQERLYFLKRLLDEYKNGLNRFDKPGESLYVANKSGRIIGVCGLNQDPYSQNPTIGRVRRLYVSQDYRRSGIGQLLVGEVIKEARKHYNLLLLRTDNPIADLFYRKIGFIAENNIKDSTHVMKLD